MHRVQSVNIYKSWLGPPVKIGKKKKKKSFSKPHVSLPSLKSGMFGSDMKKTTSSLHLLNLCSLTVRVSIADSAFFTELNLYLS